MKDYLRREILSIGKSFLCALAVVIFIIVLYEAIYFIIYGQIK
jgi:hypothetical protein